MLNLNKLTIKDFFFFTFSIICSLALFSAGKIVLNGVLAILVYSIAIVSFKRVHSSFNKFLSFSVITIISLGLLAHKIPGFNNFPIYKNIYLDDNSLPYSLWLNFDSAMILLLFYAYPYKCNGYNFKNDLKTSLSIAFFTIFTLIGAAFIVNYVKFSPKLPAILPTWIALNIITVTIEEVFVRGFLQSNFSKFFTKLFSSKTAAFIALIAAAICFGLIHYRGGHHYIILAFMAGIFYGYAYMKTGKLYCAILVHFLLNLTHILLFSYPALSK